MPRPSTARTEPLPLTDWPLTTDRRATVEISPSPTTDLAWRHRVTWRTPLERSDVIRCDHRSQIDGRWLVDRWGKTETTRYKYIASAILMTRILQYADHTVSDTDNIKRCHKPRNKTLNNTHTGDVHYRRRPSWVVAGRVTVSERVKRWDRSNKCAAHAECRVNRSLWKLTNGNKSPPCSLWSAYDWHCCENTFKWTAPI